jgi:hypothetical protein
VKYHVERASGYFHAHFDVDQRNAGRHQEAIIVTSAPDA